MSTQTQEFQFPLFIHHFELFLRSGYSLGQAFELLDQDLDGPAQQQAQFVSAELKSGTNLLTTLDSWHQKFPHPDVELFIATLKVQLEAGGNLADKLKLLGQIIEKRDSQSI